MDEIKSRLERSVSEYKGVTREESINFKKKRGKLLGLLNKEVLRSVQLDSMIGSENEELVKENHEHLIDFMYGQYQSFQARIFLDTVLWAMSAYGHRGFSKAYWKLQSEIIINFLTEEFPAETAEKLSFPFRWMQQNLEQLFDTALNKQISR